MRFFTMVRSCTRKSRCRSTRLIARVSFEGVYAFGIRSARNKCARVSESILSVLIRAVSFGRASLGSGQHGTVPGGEEVRQLHRLGSVHVFLREQNRATKSHEARQQVAAMGIR